MAWKPDYCTTAELKSFLRITDTVDDTQLGFVVTAASRAIDVECNRQFGIVAAAEQRFYTGRWDKQRCRWIIEIDDLMSTANFAAIIVDSEGVTVGTIDDYVLEPRNAAAAGKPWTQIAVRPNAQFKPTGVVDEVAVTALWGWTAVPTPVKQASLLQSSRFHARRDSPFGVAGSPDQGSELRLLNRLDVDVSVSLRDFRRWWAGV
jgi:hypothetical protein